MKSVCLIVVFIGLRREQYKPWSPHCPNGQISDIVYMPACDASKKYPPIVVKVQHTADLNFMFKWDL